MYRLLCSTGEEISLHSSSLLGRVWHRHRHRGNAHGERGPDNAETNVANVALACGKDYSLNNNRHPTTTMMIVITILSTGGSVRHAQFPPLLRSRRPTTSRNLEVRKLPFSWSLCHSWNCQYCDCHNRCHAVQVFLRPPPADRPRNARPQRTQEDTGGDKDKSRVSLL